MASDPRLGEEVGYVGDLGAVASYGSHVHSLLSAALAPCAVLQIVSRGVPDPLSILLGKWYILRTLPDPPPPWVDLLESGIDVATLVKVVLGAAAGETRVQLRAGVKIGSAQLQKAIRTATARRVQELLVRDRRGMDRAARALGRLAEQGGRIEGGG